MSPAVIKNTFRICHPVDIHTNFRRISSAGSIQTILKQSKVLKEIYIDNYKTFVNFRLELNSFQLFLGENGSGKSSIFEVLALLQDVMAGADVGETFDENTLTRWYNNKAQKFELVMEIDDESYHYTLLIDRRRQGDRIITVIKHEELRWNNKQFYLFDGNDVHLFRINRNTSELEVGTSFPGDWRRSILAQIGERGDNVPVIRFRNELSNYTTVHPIPFLMSQRVKSGTPYLGRYGENFADWFYFLLLDSQGISRKADIFLKEILIDYQYLSFKGPGIERRLHADFDGYAFDFSELSEGQRQLIFLYTLLAYMRDDKQEKTSSFFIDEPDNFVTLREIDPWWNEMNEICETPGKQVILISHHPTVVDRMGHDKALWFSRPEGKHTIVKPYTVTDGLTPAETMERGWNNE